MPEGPVILIEYTVNIMIAILKHTLLCDPLILRYGGVPIVPLGFSWHGGRYRAE